MTKLSAFDLAQAASAAAAEVIGKIGNDAYCELLGHQLYRDDESYRERFEANYQGGQHAKELIWLSQHDIKPSATRNLPADLLAELETALARCDRLESLGIACDPFGLKK